MRPILLVALVLGLIACHTGPAASPRPEGAQAHTFEARPAGLQPRDGWELFEDVIPGTTLYIDPEPLLTSRDIKRTLRTKDDAGQTAIGITLSDEAGERLYAYTREHIGESVAIFFDGKFLVAPTVQSALRNSLTITGGPNGLTDELADALANIPRREK